MTTQAENNRIKEARPNAVQMLGITAAFLGRRGPPGWSSFYTDDDVEQCERAYKHAVNTLESCSAKTVKNYLARCTRFRRSCVPDHHRIIGTPDERLPVAASPQAIGEDSA